MGTKRILARAVLAMLVLAPAAARLVSAGADTVAYKNFDAFGPVQTSDIAPPTQAGFTLQNPTTDGGVDPAVASDGTLTIHVDPNTVYYQGDPATNTYTKSTYGAVVVQGAYLQVSGRYTVTAGVYELVAEFVWSPPPQATIPAPSNPTPNLPYDADFARNTFILTGTVVQNGTGVSGNTLWSPNFGFVLGWDSTQVTVLSNFGNDTRVQQIAEAHGTSTEPGQIAVTVTGLTNYYDNGAKSDRTTTVTQGAVLYVTGHYGWDITGDWRFIANDVSNPPPTGTTSTSTVAFTETSSESQMATPNGSGGYTGSAYTGNVVSGNNFQGSSMAFTGVDWTYDTVNQLWGFTGNWLVGASSNGLGGTITGTWNPADGATSSNAVQITSATGTWSGVSGGGTFGGTNAPAPPGGAPVLTMSGSFSLTVTRTA